MNQSFFVLTKHNQNLTQQIFFSLKRQPIKLYNINKFSATQEEKFRDFSTHFVVFRVLMPPAFSFKNGLYIKALWQ